MANSSAATQYDDVLRDGFELGFTYTRSTGPVIGAFLTGLRDGKLVGIKGSNGKVICPPTEYDPQTSEELSELVDLPSTGTVTTWSWINQPHAKHVLTKPFAWALIKIDGSDTAMLHKVDAGSESAMKTGMKVKVRWAAERRGFMTDIECFEPV
ncbi:MAG: OB-fold domain-containing protein [Pseudomonadales bacterium]|nr:OB-fold domain-containing protein [Pseudomonadales bacterium]